MKHIRFLHDVIDFKIGTLTFKTDSKYHGKNKYPIVDETEKYYIVLNEMGIIEKISKTSDKYGFYIE